MIEPKRKGGRPPGTVPVLKHRNVTLPEEDWLYCLKQPGGASQFIRALIAQHRKKGEKK